MSFDIKIWDEIEPVWDWNVSNGQTYFEFYTDEIEPVWDWNQKYRPSILYCDQDEIEPVWDWNFGISPKYARRGKTKSNQCGIETCANYEKGCFL